MAIDANNFPDMVFRSEIERFDADQSGSLSETEILGITDLSFNQNDGITSLQGVEYLTALRTLHFPGNQVQTLDVSQNTNLTSLTCDDNMMTDLVLGNNTNLTDLSCSVNLLSTLDLSGVPNLKSLDCGDNMSLTSIDVSLNPNLTALKCPGNNMTVLDISSNPLLTSLDCSFNSLTSLDLSANTQLESLHCQENSLTSLDVGNNVSLINLDVSFNALTSLDLTQNPAVANFQGGNQIVNLGSIPGDGYDLALRDNRLDGNRISNMTGAVHNGTVLSGYTLNTPITYDYDSGHVNHYTLDVTLNFRASVNFNITYMDATAIFSNWAPSYVPPANYQEGTGVILPTADNMFKEGYTFGGWYDNPDFVGTPITEITSADTGDKTLYAKFIMNTYEVVFLDMNGNMIGTAQQVGHGQSAIAPTAPEVEGYTFTGWDAAFDSVTGPLTIRAQYAANTHEVIFLDKNGNMIGTAQQVGHGQSAIAPTAPGVEGYTFTGWDAAFDSVTGPLTIRAQYAPNVYQVTFTDWDGTVLETQQVVHGAAAAPTVTPSRAGYMFTGWDIAFDNVTGNLTVTAQYMMQAAKTGDNDVTTPLLVTGGSSALAAAAAFIFKKKKKSDQ